jgi:hypothetical protein
MPWLLVLIAVIAGYYVMSSGGTTEMRQWNASAPMPAVGGMSGKEAKSRIESSIKVFEDQDRENERRGIAYPNLKTRN